MVLQDEAIGIVKSIASVEVVIVKNLSGRLLPCGSGQRAFHIQVYVMVRIHQTDYDFVVLPGSRYREPERRSVRCFHAQGFLGPMGFEKHVSMISRGPNAMLTRGSVGKENRLQAI